MEGVKTGAGTRGPLAPSYHPSSSTVPSPSGVVINLCVDLVSLLFIPGQPNLPPVAFASTKGLGQ